jgi:recombination protein RecA
LRKVRHGAKDDGKGEMMDGKAKANSKYLRQVRNSMKKHGSILLLVSQVRDAVGSMIPGLKTVSGGKSVKFYAAMEFEVKRVESIRRGIHGATRELGIRSEVRVVKNRMFGTTGSSLVSILHNHGIDSTGTCIDWLVSEGVFAAKAAEGKGKSKVIESGIIPTGLVPTKRPMTREAIIKAVEESDEVYTRMIELIQTRWDAVRVAIREAAPRKPRYRAVRT